MAKRIFSFLLALILILNLLSFVSCKSTEQILVPSPSPEENPIITSTSSPTATPEPRPPYYRMNTGSSKQLVGNCVIINVFLSDTESSFSSEEKQEVMERMQEMSDCLNNQIKAYNKEVTLIYNLEDLSIDYNMTFPVSSKEWQNNDFAYNTANDIFALLDTDRISEKYNANNLSFLFHMNKDGQSHARPLNLESDSYYNEFVVIFERGGLPSVPIVYTYIHELLHLFGALDLYFIPDYTNETRMKLRHDLTNFIREHYPNEIMSTLTRNTNMNEPFICNLTAFLIGWEDHLEEDIYTSFLEEMKIE